MPKEAQGCGLQPCIRVFSKIFSCICTIGCQKFVQYIHMLYPGRFILFESVGAFKKVNVTFVIFHKGYNALRGHGAVPALTQGICMFLLSQNCSILTKYFLTSVAWSTFAISRKVFILTMPVTKWIENSNPLIIIKLMVDSNNHSHIKRGIQWVTKKKHI